MKKLYIKNAFVKLVNNINKALSDETSDEEFEKLYGHKKPGHDNPIIIACRSGRRSEMAVQYAQQLGFTK